MELLYAISFYNKSPQIALISDDIEKIAHNIKRIAIFFTHFNIF